MLSLSASYTVDLYIPFNFVKEKYEIIPRAKGTPIYMATLEATVVKLTETSDEASPIALGSTVIKNTAYGEYVAKVVIELIATMAAAYSASPPAISFQTRTIAIHRAPPIRDKPAIKPWLLS